MARSLSSLLLLLGPLFVIGFGAGALRAWSHRPGVPDRTRRAMQAAWVLLLLGGTPLWLFLAAALGIF